VRACREPGLCPHLLQRPSIVRYALGRGGQADGSGFGSNGYLRCEAAGLNRGSTTGGFRIRPGRSAPTGGRSQSSKADRTVKFRMAAPWRDAGPGQKRPGHLSPGESRVADPSRRTTLLVHAADGKQVFGASGPVDPRVGDVSGCATEAKCGRNRVGRNTRHKRTLGLPTDV
jgi:hypothetical protein